MMPLSSFIQVFWEQYRARVVMILILILLTVAALAVRQLVVEPRLQSLSEEQFRMQQLIHRRKVDFANSGIPVSMAAQLDKNIRKFNALIPQKNLFSLFLGDLFAWSEEAGLELDQIKYNPESDEETGFLRYGVNFSVKGSYAQIKEFIHLFEQSERILLVDKISLNGSGSRGKDDQVSLNISATTYFKGGAS